MAGPAPAGKIGVAAARPNGLTFQVPCFAGWGILASGTLIASGRDGRWSAMRTLLQAFILGQALMVLAVPRIWGDLDPAMPMSYVFVGGLAAALLGLSLVYVWVERHSRAMSAPAQPVY